MTQGVEGPSALLRLVYYELDQQFLHQDPMQYEQRERLLNPQLSSSYQSINQSVLCKTQHTMITTYIQSTFHRK
jgi:hypothetical protein